MSRARLLGLAGSVAAALFVVAFATSLVPWLTRERVFISSTPTNLPLNAITDVRLRHGQSVCVSGFGLDSTAEGLRFVVGSVAKAKTTPMLQVTVRAPGYRSEARLAGGYPPGTPVVVGLRAPPRRVEGASACIRNEGSTIGIVGTTNPRDLAPVDVRVDGKSSVAQPSLTFVQRRPASIIDRPGEILTRVSAFRPFPAVPFLLGALALLVILGVPFALVGALSLAERADRGDDRA
jgi:hypothetical protein